MLSSMIKQHQEAKQERVQEQGEFSDIFEMPKVYILDNPNWIH